MAQAAPLILAPLSELYGRSSILLISTIGFAIFLIPQALATNIQTLIITRFFYGCFGSTGVALGGGILAEVWSDEERGLSMALFSLSATAREIFCSFKLLLRLLLITPFDE